MDVFESGKGWGPKKGAWTRYGSSGRMTVRSHHLFFFPFFFRGMRTEMLIRLTDAVCATALHPSGSVLATASGQHHLPRRCRDGSGEEESDEDKDEVEEMYDSSLKLWAL